MGGILSVKNSSNVLDHAQYDSYQLNVAGSTVDDLQDTLEARLRKYLRAMFIYFTNVMLCLFAF